MSAAIHARSAAARATIARNLLVNVIGKDRALGRNYDDCFEMGDGDAVMACLIARVKRDDYSLMLTAFDYSASQHIPVALKNAIISHMRETGISKGVLKLRVYWGDDYEFMTTST